MARELHVDWIRCDGYGLCGDLAPDLIELDEWRYPIIREGSIPEELMNDALRAIDCCPMHALRVGEERGRRSGRRSLRSVDGSHAGS